jgi:hypothetical protein
MLKEWLMPREPKQTIQRLCQEAVRQCGLDAREIISFVKARIAEMDEDERREIERDVELLLEFTPARQAEPH